MSTENIERPRIGIRSAFLENLDTESYFKNDSKTQQQPEIPTSEPSASQPTSETENIATTSETNPQQKTKKNHDDDEFAQKVLNVLSVQMNILLDECDFENEFEEFFVVLADMVERIERLEKLRKHDEKLRKSVTIREGSIKIGEKSKENFIGQDFTIFFVCLAFLLSCLFLVIPIAFLISPPQYTSLPSPQSVPLPSSPPPQKETAIYVHGLYSPGSIGSRYLKTIGNGNVILNSNLVADKPFIVTIKKGYGSNIVELFKCDATVPINDFLPLEYQCIIKNKAVKYEINGFYTVSIKTYSSWFRKSGNIKFENTYFSVKY